MKKRLLLLTGLIAALGVAGWTSTVNADPFVFDPDGPSGPNAPQVIGGLDWQPGNSLAVSALPLAPGSTFQLLYQARLGSLLDTNGNAISTPGLNGTPGAPAFQITVVASFTEVVTSVSGSPTSATFSLAPVQSPNSFLEIWFNNAVVANNLAGTGFNTGTKILSGMPSAMLSNGGNFTIFQSTGTLPPFDSFGANDYPGITSVVGAGGALINSFITSQDSGFFVTPLTVGSTSFNTSQKTPFDSTDPSMKFSDMANGVTPSNVTPNIGTINGANGKDFQFQADGNESFSPTIPEPASVVLLCMGLSAGLLGRGWLNRRRVL